jgi:hypothetical protein
LATGLFAGPKKLPMSRQGLKQIETDTQFLRKWLQLSDELEDRYVAAPGLLISRVWSESGGSDRERLLNLPAFDRLNALLQTAKAE